MYDDEDENRPKVTDRQKKMNKMAEHCINREYVERENKKRAELGDSQLPFDEFLWYRKERKPIEDDDDREKIPEHELPDEVNFLNKF